MGAGGRGEGSSKHTGHLSRAFPANPSTEGEARPTSLSPARQVGGWPLEPPACSTYPARRPSGAPRKIRCSPDLSFLKCEMGRRVALAFKDC